jgi:hypothetical protein
MAKYTDPAYRIATNAFMRDRHGNEYTGEQLLLALLLHCTGKRTVESVAEVAALLDDPNIIKKTRRS